VMWQAVQDESAGVSGGAWSSLTSPSGYGGAVCLSGLSTRRCQTEATFWPLDGIGFFGALGLFWVVRAILKVE
jgi:hypothetical protein